MAVVSALSLELGKPPTFPGVTYGLFAIFVAVEGMRGSGATKQPMMNRYSAKISERPLTLPVQ
jgi:hypothetical protein